MGNKLTDANRLSIKYPDIAKEWHPVKNYPLNPCQVSCGSAKKIWWQCSKCGHEWQARVYTRKSDSGCPLCSGRFVPENKRLWKTHPELSAEWDFDKNGSLTPKNISKGSSKKIWWKCKNGHEWEATPNVRTFQNTGCPYCNSSRLSKENNLAVQHPNLSKEWNVTKNNNLTPYDVTPLTNKVVWWKCHKGHEWKARVSHRSRCSSNCPYCSKIELIDGTFFHSQVEAFWYLMFTDLKMEFKHDLRYKKEGIGIGRCRYDFYFPKDNVYVEVTSYTKQCKYWNRYIERIQKKKNYVENILKSRFCFVQYFMTTEDIKYLKKYIK